MKFIQITTLFLITICFSSNAQQYIQDIQGNVLTEQSKTDVIGSPFLKNEFTNGNVVLTNGNKYENVPLKYDVSKDELYFKNPKDESMLSFVIPVKSFELEGRTYLNGFPVTDNFNQNSYYELIFNGNIKLLIKNYKAIIENKNYNSAVTEKRFEDFKAYYMLKEGKMIRFKPSKKDLLETFNDKSAEIDAFLKKEKIDLKSNDDLAKVFEYYSSTL